jgi:hypothetical protein
MDKTSTKVMWTRESSSRIATKAIKNIKEIREEMREEMWFFPPSSN